MIRLILADDHNLVLEGLRLLLEAEEDLEVVAEAKDGRTAVNLARDHQPDLALLDVTMPDLNGIDAADRIGEASPDTKIIMLSMHATVEHIARAIQAGASGYLLKDSVGKEVVEAIRRVMAGERVLSQKIDADKVDEYLRRRDANSDNPLDALSTREREVMQLVVEGHTSVQIAKMAHLSPKTVETYRSRIMQKLGLKDIPSLVKFAIAHGLTSSST